MSHFEIKSWSRTRITPEWLRTDAKAPGPPVLDWQTNNLFWLMKYFPENGPISQVTSSYRFVMNNVLYMKKIFHISSHFIDNTELGTVVPGICIYLFIFKTQGQILVCDRVKGDSKSFLFLKMCLKNVLVNWPEGIWWEIRQMACFHMTTHNTKD